MTTAIILAGGTGTRVGANIPKQFIKIQNKPILAYTLEIFQNNKNIDNIEIVCHKDYIEEVKNIIKEYNITKTKYITNGGNTFQESVINGILNLKDKINKNDIVTISFGVSPLTKDEDIIDSIEKAKLYGNGISSTNIDLCTCIKDNEESTTQNIIRETLKGFANPWSFNYGELLETYEYAIKNNIIDKIEPHTTSLYLYLNKPLYFSSSNTRLCKITTKEDLEIFEGILLLRKEKQNDKL